MHKFKQFVNRNFQIARLKINSIFAVVACSNNTLQLFSCPKKWQLHSNSPPLQELTTLQNFFSSQTNFRHKNITYEITTIIDLQKKNDKVKLHNESSLCLLELVQKNKQMYIWWHWRNHNFIKIDFTKWEFVIGSWVIMQWNQ